MSSTRPYCVWSMAVLIAGIVPTAAQDGRDDGLLCNAICQAQMQPAQAAVAPVPDPSTNDPDTAPPRAQRRAAVKQSDVRTGKITPPRVETAAPKQHVVVELPEYYPLPAAPRTLESRAIGPPLRTAMPALVATVELEPTKQGGAVKAQGEPMRPPQYNPPGYLLLRSDVKALADGESRPIAVVSVSETHARSALGALTIKGQFVQRSLADALVHVRDGRDAAAVVPADGIVKELQDLSLDGIRGIPLTDSVSQP